MVEIGAKNDDTHVPLSTCPGQEAPKPAGYEGAYAHPVHVEVEEAAGLFCLLRQAYVKRRICRIFLWEVPISSRTGMARVLGLRIPVAPSKSSLSSLSSLKTLIKE